MKNTPKVTVIVTFYNITYLIQKSINSFLDPSPQKMEVIEALTSQSVKN